MKLCFRGLEKTEAGEVSPLNIILCASKNTEQIELLELGYLTVLLRARFFGKS